MRTARACLIVLCLASCASAADAPAPQVQGASMDLAKLAGTPVDLTGTARDAKLGAVLVLDDGTPVYIAGLESWDSARAGKRVRARGTLVSKKLAPDPVVGPDGAVSAGMEGEAWVIEGAHVEPL